MNYAQIRTMDISDGPGIRIGIYVQGCDHRCEGCYNYTTWNYNGGNKWTDETHRRIIEILKPSYINGLSLLGGDPLCCYIREPEILLDLVKDVKLKFPAKTIWLWTGYTFEEIYNFTNKKSTKLQRIIRPLLDYIDVIVDGRYDKSLRVNGVYYGSSNQRVIDVPNSIKNNFITTLE